MLHNEAKCHIRLKHPPMMLLHSCLHCTGSRLIPLIPICDITVTSLLPSDQSIIVALTAIKTLRQTFAVRGSKCEIATVALQLLLSCLEFGTDVKVLIFRSKKKSLSSFKVECFPYFPYFSSAVNKVFISPWHAAAESCREFES